MGEVIPYARNLIYMQRLILKKRPKISLHT